MNPRLTASEACGTSGEKAALNGALNCSVLDGWWAEMFDGENGWAISSAELEDQLSRRTLQPCSPFELLSRGWVPPADTGRLLHTVNQQHLIALGVDQKLLPGSIIRQVAKERAALIHVLEGEHGGEQAALGKCLLPGRHIAVLLHDLM